MELREFERLQKKVKSKEAEVQQSKGALKASLAELEEKYGCSSIKEAKALLKRKEKEAKTLSAKFEESMEEFKEEYGDDLGL